MTAYPPPVANFRLVATLPPARDATSVSAAPHFRRRARPGAHAQTELRRGLGGKGCGAMLCGDYVRPVLSSRRPKGVRRVLAGGLFLSPLSPASAVCGPAAGLRALCVTPSWSHCNGARAPRGPHHHRDNNNNRPGGKGTAAVVSCFVSVRPQNPDNSLPDFSGTEVHSAINCIYYSVLL